MLSTFLLAVVFLIGLLQPAERSRQSLKNPKLSGGKISRALTFRKERVNCFCDENAPQMLKELLRHKCAKSSFFLDDLFQFQVLPQSFYTPDPGSSPRYILQSLSSTSHLFPYFLMRQRLDDTVKYMKAEKKTTF